MSKTVMKKILIAIVLLFLFSLAIFGQEFTQIADGVEHAKFTRKNKDEPVNVNLLKLDLTKVRLDVVHALDAAIGLETTSSLATRHKGIAAINAGFFKMEGLYKGDAAGILQIDSKLLSESYGNRIGLLINNDLSETKTAFAHINKSGMIVFKTKKDKKILTEVGLNRQRGKDDLLIFTPEFHRTTLTDSNGLEIIIKNNKITQIIDGKGSNLIPTDGFVVSASGKKRDELLALVKIGNQAMWYGSSVDLSKTSHKFSSNVEQFTMVEDIIAGVPQLIKNGKIEITWEQEKIGKDFVETRHPRTAVAKLKDGKFLMITVDGRQPNVSVGMNLYELAEMLLEFGAVEAMNLDGGGSTTMFVKDRLVNIPSDKTGERPVSDAILVTLRSIK
jgi:exopolysaccharide biosynthesis protein